MRTIYVYLTKQTVATMVMTVAVFAFVLLLGNIMKEILTLLVNGQASLWLVLKAFLLLVPFVLVFALPMGMLTATLLLFGRLSADQELTAMRAGGISLISLSTPVLIISMLMSALCAWINMEIAPYCRSTYKQLIREVKVGELTDLLQPNVPMTDIPGQFIHIKGKRKVGDTVYLKGIRYIKYDGESYEYEIFAPGGTIQANEETSQLFMTMTNYTILRPKPSSSENISVNSNELDSTGYLLFKGEQFAPDPFTIERDSELFRKPKLHHMSFKQLQEELVERTKLTEYIKALPSFKIENLRAELEENFKRPFDPITPVKVQMHRQLAFSYACFAFTLIGIPLGIRAHRRETSIGIAIALMLVAIYYGFVVFANALESHSEWAPHLVMWLPNFLFQAIGSVLMWRANKGM